MGVEGSCCALDTLLDAGVKDADILIGAKRLINEFSYLNKPSHNAFLSDEIADLISKSDAEKIAILVSGDVGFYSGAEKLVCALSEYDPILVPGISSVSYFGTVRIQYCNTFVD